MLLLSAQIDRRWSVLITVARHLTAHRMRIQSEARSRSHFLKKTIIGRESHESCLTVAAVASGASAEQCCPVSGQVRGCSDVVCYLVTLAVISALLRHYVAWSLVMFPGSPSTNLQFR